MLFEVEAALDLIPAIRVSDVVLTIGHGGLRIACSTVSSLLRPLGRPLSMPRADRRPDCRIMRRRRVLCDPAGAHFGGFAGGAFAAAGAAAPGRHRDRCPRRKVSSTGSSRATVSRRASRGRLVAAEHKLITAGGFYDRVGDYAGLMRRGSAAKAMQRSACDFSISYDYGATFNALAKCFAVAAAGRRPPRPMPRPTGCAPPSTRRCPIIASSTATGTKSARTRSSRASCPSPCSAWRRCSAPPAPPSTCAGWCGCAKYCSISRCRSRTRRGPRPPRF